ncbi:MAG: N-acetylglucosamine-6-phosphate deacetylase [Planctomycetota bacterium]|jgi:N-acetylglucosamine-6-phosphate deacetylase
MGSKAQISNGIKIRGLVDLQVNGYKGVHFSDINLTRDDFILACRGVFDAGTTAFLPTMITSPKEVYEHNLPLMAAVMQEAEFQGKLLGFHIEGPFISTQEGARGAHDTQWISKPDVDYLRQLIEWADGRVKLLTIAAEPDGSEKVARYAVEHGISVSLGHQMAGQADLARLTQAGAVSMTHLGNGVPAMLSRHENPVWAGLGNDDLIAMIITDGHHLPESILKTIIRTKGSERCVVVSDASSPAGLKAGKYEALGHQVMLEEDGLLRDLTTGYLGGSSASMLQCMNHLASLDMVGADELLAMGFDNPLALIRLGPDDIARGRDIRFDQERKIFYLQV